MGTPNATIVLVHGAWHGSWCWERVTPLLEKRGLAVRTVDLPSVGARPGAGTDLSADAAAVEVVLDAVGGPVVLVGHSYGGMVISRVRPQGIAHLVYVCAFVPLEGQSLITAGSGRPASWIQMLDGGLMQPDAARADEVFYTDCDPATREWAKSKLRAQSAAIMAEAVARPAWRDVPSTYVVCVNDGALPAEVQRDVFAPRMSHVVELQADHSPFLSQPAALAEVLVSRASEVTRASRSS
jgi:pimeloyl-ACP methyl ester carboxylesterase